MTCDTSESDVFVIHVELPAFESVRTFRPRFPPICMCIVLGIVFQPSLWQYCGGFSRGRLSQRV
jgi:hypothetical protein